MPLKVFYTSVTGSLKIRKHQEKIFSILDGKKIDYELVDISQNSQEKDLMREMAGNPTALPPQICNGDIYCGDYAEFENAVEMEDLEAFLKL